MIDAIGTGFSRAANVELNKKFWAVRGDIEVFGDFSPVHHPYERWSSPLFMWDSYGRLARAQESGYPGRPWNFI